jgi:hypothetical protein
MRVVSLVPSLTEAVAATRPEVLVGARAPAPPRVDHELMDVFDGVPLP